MPHLPEDLSDLATPRVVAAGAEVFRLGAPARHVFFLRRGRVVLRRFAATGEEVAIHAAEAGEFFAEAALQAEHYHCTAVAAQDSEVLAIPSLDLRRRIATEPAFALAWLGAMAAQLRQARARVERLSLRSAAERVRHLLLTEGQGATPSHVVAGTLRELATQLGMTHEALYRTLAAMQRAGTLRRDGQRLTLLR